MIFGKEQAFFKKKKKEKKQTCWNVILIFLIEFLMNNILFWYLYMKQPFFKYYDIYIV